MLPLKLPLSSSSRCVLLGLAASLVLGPTGRAAAALDSTPLVTATQAKPPATTEQEIDQRLEGKFFFLRGFYLDDKLEFDTTGKVVGNPQRGSFTLSGLEVRKVHATKHSIVIEADRIGLHFFGGLPYEDDSKPFERIKVSKKPVEITIDRLVIEPEKKKKKKQEAKAAPPAKPLLPGQPANATAPAPTTDTATSGVANPPDVTFDEPANTTTAASGTKTDMTAKAAPATMAQLPAEPIHPDPKQSWIQLSKAIEVVFAPGLDDSVIATLPDYWQTYFATKQGKIQAEKIDNSVLHPGNGVVSPKLLSSLDPASNDYAQKANIAGMTLLSTVVGSSGQPSHVTIVRPIGFGLDEKAVDAVSHARFQPGLRDGQPVPVMVNLQVTFRIYSDRTRPIPGAAPPAPAPATPASNPSPSKNNGKEVAAISQQ
jgi:TonB family protein